MKNYGLITLATVLMTGACQAAVVVELEADGTSTNGTLVSAQKVLDSTFTIPSPATAKTGRTATIEGRSSILDVDFYEFTSHGGHYFFDIDDADGATDLSIVLFSSLEALIGYADDNFPLDPGTISSLDPALGFIWLPAGTYYAAIANFINPPTELLTNFGLSFHQLSGGGVAVDGANPNSAFESNGLQEASLPYVLHITSVPEPSSMLLLSLGGLIAFRTRRRKLA